MLNWHLDGAFRDEVASSFNPESKFGVGYFEMDSFWTWNGSVTLEAEHGDLGLFVQNFANEEGITEVCTNPRLALATRISSSSGLVQSGCLLATVSD